MTTNTSNTDSPIPSPNATRWLYIILGIFAIFIIGLSIWLISIKSNLRVLQEEKELQRVELQNEVDSLLVVHNQIKTAYGELSDSFNEKLNAKDSIIQANAVEIKRLLDTEWEYMKVKKKLTSLQSISQNYVKQMDSLYTANRELTEENERIREEYNIEKKRNVQLNKVKEELTDKVESAAVLRSFNLKAEGIRQRGGTREIATDKANRVERIKICFTLAENAIVKPGEKDLYLRIALPDNSILMKGRGDEYSFMFKGERLQYSIAEKVDYTNEDKNVCVFWDRRDTQELQSGLYNVDIFEGDNQIGQTSFVLK